MSSDDDYAGEFRNARLPGSVAEILASPDGPEVGAAGAGCAGVCSGAAAAGVWAALGGSLAAGVSAASGVAVAAGCAAFASSSPASPSP